MSREDKSSWAYQFELEVEPFPTLYTIHPTLYTIHLKFLKAFKNLNYLSYSWGKRAMSRSSAAHQGKEDSSAHGSQRLAACSRMTKSVLEAVQR